MMCNHDPPVSSILIERSHKIDSSFDFSDGIEAFSSVVARVATKKFQSCGILLGGEWNVPLRKFLCSSFVGLDSLAQEGSSTTNSIFSQNSNGDRRKFSSAGGAFFIVHSDHEHEAPKQLREERHCVLELEIADYPHMHREYTVYDATISLAQKMSSEMPKHQHHDFLGDTFSRIATVLTEGSTAKRPVRVLWTSSLDFILSFW